MQSLQKAHRQHPDTVRDSHLSSADLVMPVPPERFIPDPLVIPLPPERFRIDPDAWYAQADPGNATFMQLIDTLEARLDAHQELEPHVY